MIHTIVMAVSRFNEFLFLFLMLIDDVQIGRDEAELIKMIIEDVRKGTEVVNGLLLNAIDVQVNAKPFEKMDNLCNCEHALEVWRDGTANSCLTKLNLENCHLSYLSEEIGNLISLRTLNLSGNNLSTLPDTIGKLSCLKDLSVDNNKLSHLPSEIGELDSLKTLDLWGNRGSKALPESICKLVRLQSLNLHACNLSHLPSEIDGLISLRSLNLSFCHLSHLPSGIGGLTSLEDLCISGSNFCPYQIVSVAFIACVSFT
ncbi:hypothetical protein RHSIM_Rhsim01G0095500 [Rhododendron simsii]|uniref:Disease resistance R13L4/SHOC-2-like LRR domain-containing protein n=1 Tax=Rhododendron simsii TaxID=118357 RepID=A0A834HPU4_RHOSS|nr:hypothetical protein RHSIM_Rhsim01G0095500 [Rhododendron simsii]